MWSGSEVGFSSVHPPVKTLKASRPRGVRERSREAERRDESPYGENTDSEREDAVSILFPHGSSVSFL